MVGDYYPFGLTMAGISSKALNNSPENRYKFNDGTELANKEFSDGSGLEWYETPFRMYDPQIGRFFQIDGMADDYAMWTPYAFGMNNPIFFNDPSGLASEPPEEKSTPDNPTELASVTVKGSYKNKWNYTDWTMFVDMNKGHDQGDLAKYLRNKGVDEKGMKLFNQAWSGIAYRERLAEIEAGWRDFIKEALIEGATWAAGGLVMKVGGKLVALGYREFKIYQKFKAANKTRVFWSGGGNPAVETAAREFATKNGMTTLEMTRAGQNMMKLTEGMSWDKAAPLWQRISSKFATGAKGTVHVFQNTGGIGVNSVWGTVEYPILKQKGVEIIYHLVP